MYSNRFFTCGVGHNMAPHHSSVSSVSVWAPTGGSVNPLPQNWAEPSWSLSSHQRPEIWVVRGRRVDGRDVGRWDDSQWHQGVSLLCRKQDAPLYRQTASSSHSGWETAHDWIGALMCSEPKDCLPGGGGKLLLNIYMKINWKMWDIHKHSIQINHFWWGFFLNLTR